MTSGRFLFPFVPWVLAGALVVNTLGCSGGSGGCTNCPPMEGRYALVLGEGTDSAGCRDVAPRLPQGPLEVSRQGSALSATLDGVTLSGTLYQTYDFRLLALGDEDGGTPGRLESETLLGRYVPAAGDGGVVSLVGDFQGDFTSSSAAGTVRCSVTRSFTATRQ